MSLSPLADEGVVVPVPAVPRRPWTPPLIEALPRLTELTLLSPIGGGGGTGGSTVFGLLLAAGLLFGIGACSDEIERPSGMTPGRPVASAQLFTCRADVAAGTLECMAPQRSAAGQQVIGGQGIFVGLRSSTTSYTPGTQTFAATVSVQNETGFSLGTLDGATKDSGGIKVFFVDGPTPDVGSVNLSNNSGVGTFTASNQPYFKYDTLLTSQEVSAGKVWDFVLGGGASTFTFHVLVTAAIPAAGSVLRWSQEPGATDAGWGGVSGWGTDGLALFGDAQEVSAHDNGVWRSPFDPDVTTQILLNQRVAGNGPKDLYNYVIDNSTLSIRHWDGISWRSIQGLANGPSNPGDARGIGTTGPGGFFAFGNSYWTFDGTSWTNHGLHSGVSAIGATFVGGSDLFAVEVAGQAGRVWVYHAGAWSQVGGSSSGQSQPGLIIGTDANDLWTVSGNGSDDEIRYWDGSSWTTQAAPSGETDNDDYTVVGGVALSSTDAYLITNNVSSIGHLWHWDGSHWNDVKTNGRWPYTGIWARSDGTLYLTEGHGGVEQYISGSWEPLLPAVFDGTNAVSVQDGFNAFAGANSGALLRYDGDHWTADTNVGFPITSVHGWNGLPGSAFAADGDSIVYYFNPFASSNWSPMSVDGGLVTVIGGMGPGDVWGAGPVGHLTHWNGLGGWTTSEAPGALTSANFTGIWGQNTQFEIASLDDGTLAHYNGSIWTIVPAILGPVPLRAVSATDSTDIWAVGDGGAIIHCNVESCVISSSGTSANLTGVWAVAPDEVYAVGANRTVLVYNGTSWGPVATEAGGGVNNYRGVAVGGDGTAFIAGDRMLRGTR